VPQEYSSVVQRQYTVGAAFGIRIEGRKKDAHLDDGIQYQDKCRAHATPQGTKTTLADEESNGLEYAHLLGHFGLFS